MFAFSDFGRPFSNHALIVIKQLPNNHFHISNVTYPIHLINCHYIVLIIMLTSTVQAVLWYCSKLSITAIKSNFRFDCSTVLLMQSTMTHQLINQVIFHWHIIHKVWPFALLATHLNTLWELAWHLHKPPREYFPGWLCATSQPWKRLV